MISNNAINNKIHLSVLSAELFAHSNLKGNIDTYVKAVYGGQPFKSNLVSNGGMKPQFNQNHEFNLAADTDINFELWRNTKGAEQLLGTGLANLSAIKQAPNGSLEVPLTHEKKPSGKLLIVARIVEAPKSQEQIPQENQQQQQQSLNQSAQLQQQQSLNLSAQLQHQQSLNQSAQLQQQQQQQQPQQQTLNQSAQLQQSTIMDPNKKPGASVNIDDQVKSVSLKDYYDHSGLTSVLQKGLEEIGKTRPQDPIQFLGKFLLDNDKSNLAGGGNQ